jgi:nucleoside-diphosphate-sugar epimerase
MNRATSKVLLTGATGFLGSHLLKGLLASGHAVVVLKRSGSSTARIAGHLSCVSSYDLDSVPLKAVFERAPIDAVIHAATAYGREGVSAGEVVATNVVLGTELLEAAAACGVPLFMNTGTFSAKGVELPDGLAQYVRTKRQFSEIGVRFAARSRIAFVELQLEHVYGPADGKTKFVPTLLEALIEGRAEFDLTRGAQLRDFVYVDDVVAAYLRVLERRADIAGPSQRFEVGSGEAVALADFVRLAREIAGSATKLNFGALPDRAGDMPHSAADISALRRLGWAPQVSLREGLERTVRAMREARPAADMRRTS